MPHEPRKKTRLDDITARYTGARRWAADPPAPDVLADVAWLIDRVKKLEADGAAVVRAYDTDMPLWSSTNVERLRDALEMPVPELPDNAWEPIP